MLHKSFNNYYSLLIKSMIYEKKKKLFQELLELQEVFNNSYFNEKIILKLICTIIEIHNIEFTCFKKKSTSSISWISRDRI